MFPTVNTASITDLSSALAQSKVQDNASTGSKAYIGFDFQSGEYTFGRDKTEITDDNIVINTSSFTHGWILWVNRTSTKVMRSFVEDLPAPMPNGPAGEQPAESRGFEARFEDDPDTVLVFETSSYGGRKGCDKILNEIRIRSAGGESEYLFPIVRLTSENYQSKQGRTVYNPIFEVVGWMNQEGDIQQNVQKLEAQVEPEEAVVTRRRRQA